MESIKKNLEKHEEILEILKGMEFKFIIKNGELKEGCECECNTVSLKFNKNGFIKDAIVIYIKNLRAT